MTDYREARLNMVDCQLRTNRVVDPVLIEAFSSVPRERFVAEGHESVAYIDKPVPVGAGRLMMPPMLLGILLQELAIAPDDVVLDIGCGTGYSCAVMAALAATVVGIECEDELVTKANSILSDLAVDNAAVVKCDLASGKEDQGPYDIILVGGSVDRVSETLLEQLSVGGRLVAVENTTPATGQACLYLKAKGGISRRILCDANLPPLKEFATEPGFVF